jgi:hypothetical protein
LAASVPKRPGARFLLNINVNRGASRDKIARSEDPRRRQIPWLMDDLPEAMTNPD